MSALPKKGRPDPPVQPSGSAPQTPDEDSLLVAIFEEHRALLFSVAYRMLGSRADAEDMLQETFLRWRQVSLTEVESPRAFLVSVITHLCISHMQSARAKREQYFGQWLPEPLLTGPESDVPRMPALDGSLSMAFLLLLERLSPMERAVLLLREVFDYEYDEIAAMLGQSEVNCRQILRRAKQHVAEGRPRFDVSRQQRERVLQQFIQTLLNGDMRDFLALLAEDVVLYTDGGGKVPAVPNPIYGAERVARFFVGVQPKVPPDLVKRFVEINGEPGVIAYRKAEVFGVFSLDVVGGKIRNIYIVRNPDKLAQLPILSHPVEDPASLM